MFASQLSRILQTLQADVNYETCSAFDRTEEEKNMKENQPEVVCKNDEDTFTFKKKDAFYLNGNYNGDEFENVTELDFNGFVDCPLKNNLESKFETFPAKNDQTGLFHFIARKAGEDKETLALASDINDIDRYSPEFETYMIVNLSGAASATDVSNDENATKSISCYKENNYNPFGDIGVDNEEVSVEIQKDDQADSCVSTNEEKEDSELHNQDCPKLSPEVNINEHADNDTYLEDLVKLFGSKCSTNEQAINASEKESFGERSLHLESSSMQNSQEPVSSFNFDGDAHEVLASQKPSEEEILTGETAVSAIVNMQDVPNHSEDKSKANILMCREDQFADGEASFSALGSMMGLISYSGSVPYSGSISCRSDSSATSARSFAFPILQSEWNSSPVKMKKENKRFRKHRGWRQGLLCCRF